MGHGHRYRNESHRIARTIYSHWHRPNKITIQQTPRYTRKSLQVFLSLVTIVKVIAHEQVTNGGKCMVPTSRKASMQSWSRSIVIINGDNAKRPLVNKKCVQVCGNESHRIVTRKSVGNGYGRNVHVTAFWADNGKLRILLNTHNYLVIIWSESAVLKTCYYARKRHISYVFAAVYKDLSTFQSKVCK
jgi:hypothetical protein